MSKHENLSYGRGVCKKAVCRLLAAIISFQICAPDLLAQKNTVSSRDFISEEGAITVSSFVLPASDFLDDKSKKVFIEQAKRWKTIKTCGSFQNNEDSGAP